MLHLFSNESLKDFLDRNKINLKREIESTEDSYLLTVTEKDFVNYLISKYSFEAITLCEKGITQKQEEIRLNGYEKSTPLNPTMLTGKIQLTINIPFEGNSHLFHCRPSKSLYQLPSGKVEIEHQNKRVKLEYELDNQKTDITKDLIFQDIENLKRWLVLVNDDLAIHNYWIKEKVRELTKP